MFRIIINISKFKIDIFKDIFFFPGYVNHRFINITDRDSTCFDGNSLCPEACATSNLQNFLTGKYLLQTDSCTYKIVLTFGFYIYFFIFLCPFPVVCNHVLVHHLYFLLTIMSRLNASNAAKPYLSRLLLPSTRNKSLSKINKIEYDRQKSHKQVSTAVFSHF